MSSSARVGSNDTHWSSPPRFGEIALASHHPRADHSDASVIAVSESYFFGTLCAALCSSRRRRVDARTKLATRFIGASENADDGTLPRGLVSPKQEAPIISGDGELKNSRSGPSSRRMPIAITSAMPPAAGTRKPVSGLDHSRVSRRTPTKS